MKLAFLAGLFAIALTGCSTYHSNVGAPGDDYYNGGTEVGTGSAADVRSPGDLDRARGPKEDPWIQRRDHSGNNPW